MHTYHLQDEFTDTAAERMLLAALGFPISSAKFFTVGQLS